MNSGSFLGLCHLWLGLLVLPLGLVAQTTEDPTLNLEGEGLSVVGAIELNQQVQTLDRGKIERAQAPDLPTLLTQTLGLSLVRNGGYGNQAGVSLRGFGGGRVAVLVDGVPVNSAQSGDFDLSRIPLSSVQKIEVISGGSDTKYNINGAIGGIINLITIHQPDPGTHWGGSLSNQAYVPSRSQGTYLDTQAADLHASGADDHKFWTLDVNTHRAANEYPFVTETGVDRRWSGNGVVDAGLAGTLGFSLPEDRRLVVSANGYFASKDIHGTVNSAVGGHQNEVSSRSSLLWSDGSVGSDALTTDLTVSHRLTGLEWTDFATHSVHNLNTVGVISRWDWAVVPGISIQGGGDFDYSLLVSNTLGVVHDDSGGLFTTILWSPTPAWDLVSSVKLIYAKDLPTPIPVPKLGLVVRWNEVTLKNNYFRTFKLPTINDRYWPEDATARGNPNLLPEDGWGTDFIVGVRLPGWFLWDSSWYANRHLNAISWQTGAGKWTPRNVGEAVYLGAGNSAKTDLPGPWEFRVSYDYLMTWVLSDGLTFADDKRMPYKPVHTAGMGVSYSWDSGSVEVDGHYESQRFLSTLNLASLAPFATLDVALDQRVEAGLTLFCAAKNLLDQSYSTIDGYPMPGRSVTIGLRYEAP